jgi:type IV secretion system protein VirB10
LESTISSKTSNDGDRVYLTTQFPITINGRIVIPPGSAVSATVTEVARPGKVKGRGSFFLRFDSITLPNGTSRSLRSRPTATDATQSGTLDRDEGQVKGEGNKSGDARTVGATTGTGAAIGSIGGVRGAGVGAAAGAAVGLGKVLFSRGPGATLAKGSVVEMTLDRDLTFRQDELR